MKQQSEIIPNDSASELPALKNIPVQLENASMQMYKSSDISMRQKEFKVKMNYSGRNEAYAHASSNKFNSSKFVLNKSPDSVSKQSIIDDSSIPKIDSENRDDNNAAIKINEESKDAENSQNIVKIQKASDTKEQPPKRKITILSEPKIKENIYRKLVFERTQEPSIHSDLEKIKFKSQYNFRGIDNRVSQTKNSSKIMEEEAKEGNASIIIFSSWGAKQNSKKFYFEATRFRNVRPRKENLWK